MEFLFLLFLSVLAIIIDISHCPTMNYWIGHYACLYVVFCNFCFSLFFFSVFFLSLVPLVLVFLVFLGLIILGFDFLCVFDFFVYFCFVLFLIEDYPFVKISIDLLTCTVLVCCSVINLNSIQTEPNGLVESRCSNMLYFNICGFSFKRQKIWQFYVVPNKQTTKNSPSTIWAIFFMIHLLNVQFFSFVIFKRYEIIII